ncbi:MAG: hypothetical protein GX076_09400 [Clostridiales bacterium]|nr:hypothetical protein [Clostridiales bacterium]
MRALAYLILTRFKNRIKNTIKNPGALIFIIFIIALIVISVTRNSSDIKTYRNISEVYAMITALYIWVFVMSCLNGLSKGASLYSMPDVSLVFVSPISTKKVLLFGLIQQMGTSLLIGVFLIFQYGWLHSVYGVSMVFLIYILLGYAVVIFCGQLSAMMIYSLTTGDDRRKAIGKSIIFAVCGITVFYVLLNVYLDKDNMIYAAVSVANNLPTIFFPIGGWTQAAVVGFWTGQWLKASLGVLAIVIYVGAIVSVLTKAKADFYEDVLQATEASYSAISASKEGRIDSALPYNVKLGKIGIGKGFGANSFYYKHLLESRRSRTFILDRLTLIFMVVNIAFAVFMKNVGIVAVFSFATYMQVFSVALGRWIRELILPYIYLVPEPAFIKLLHCLRESIRRLVVEAIILFVIIGLILDLSPAEIIFAIFARISFGLLFNAGNILIERFFSGITIKVVTVFIYIIIMIVISIPAVAAAMLVNSLVDLLSPTVQNFMVIGICNFIVSFVVIFICRNMLEYAELNLR